MLLLWGVSCISALFLSATAICAVLFAAPVLQPKKKITAAGSTAVFLAAGAIWLSFISNASRHERWRLRLQCAIELSRLKRLLFDLLPPSVAERMLQDVEKPPFEQRRAVILQVQTYDSFARFINFLSSSDHCDLRDYLAYAFFFFYTKLKASCQLARITA